MAPGEVQAVRVGQNTPTYDKPPVQNPTQQVQQEQTTTTTSLFTSSAAQTTSTQRTTSGGTTTTRGNGSDKNGTGLTLRGGNLSSDEVVFSSQRVTGVDGGDDDGSLDDSPEGRNRSGAVSNNNNIEGCTGAVNATGATGAAGVSNQVGIGQTAGIRQNRAQTNPITGGSPSNGIVNGTGVHYIQDSAIGNNSVKWSSGDYQEANSSGQTVFRNGYGTLYNFYSQMGVANQDNKILESCNAGLRSLNATSPNNSFGYASIANDPRMQGVQPERGLQQNPEYTSEYDENAMREYSGAAQTNEEEEDEELLTAAGGR